MWSLGSAILLLNNNINLIRVIGIHKQGSNSGEIKINYGTFIGEILNKELNNNDENNYITSEIYIKDVEVNKNIRLINLYEEYLRNGKNKNKLLKDPELNNEEEIKNCLIIVNEELLPFNYFYKFKSKGKYIMM